jgi:hypothetical protein
MYFYFKGVFPFEDGRKGGPVPLAGVSPAAIGIDGILQTLVPQILDGEFSFPSIAISLLGSPLPCHYLFFANK